MNIRHFPAQDAFAPLPSEIADAANPGSVTLLCASPKFPLAETLIALSLELAKTRETAFVNCEITPDKFNDRLFSVVLGKDLRDSRNTPLTDADWEKIKNFASEQRIMRNLEFFHGCNCRDDLSKAFHPNGAIVVNYAQIFSTKPQSVVDFADLAKSQNVAVVEGVMIHNVPDNPNAVVPGLDRCGRAFVDSADSVFVFTPKRISACGGRGKKRRKPNEHRSHGSHARPPRLGDGC